MRAPHATCAVLIFRYSRCFPRLVLSIYPTILSCLSGTGSACFIARLPPCFAFFTSFSGLCTATIDWNAFGFATWCLFCALLPSAADVLAGGRLLAARAHSHHALHIHHYTPHTHAACPIPCCCGDAGRDRSFGTRRRGGRSGQRRYPPAGCPP